MRRRQRCQCRDGGQDSALRQHGLDAFAGRHDIAAAAEADGVSEQFAHGSSWRVDRSAAEIGLAESARIEPGAVGAGELAFEVGDRRDHCRPCFGRAALWTVIAARMKPKAPGLMQDCNRASAQIPLHKRSWYRLRHGDQPPRRFGRAARSGTGLLPPVLWFVRR